MTRSPPWSPPHIQVPGPKDMELGVPWPGGVTRLSRPGRDQRLDSFESFVNKAREPHFGALFSSVSAIGPLVPTLEPSKNINSEDIQITPMSDLRVTILQDSPYDLTIPEVAQASSGGWFDPSNWLFKLTMDNFGTMSNKELLQAYFAREDRPEYGEDHVSTRGKRLVEDEFHEEADAFYLYGKQKATENHKIQERDRRDRHRVLQKEGYNCTPTAVFKMTEQVLPDIKDIIRTMPKEKTVLKIEHKAKRTGKDEQLTAAAIMPHLSNLLIFRLLSGYVETEKKLQQLEERLQDERRARVEFETKSLQLENANRHLSDELAQLQLTQNENSRRNSTTLFADSLLSAPFESWKHPAAEPRYSTNVTSSSNKPDSYHGAKRPRLDRFRQPSRFTNYCRLPPSPSPDCDDYRSFSHSS